MDTLCLRLLGSGCFLSSRLNIVGGFLDSFGGVFLHVFASSHHQFNGVHLNFLGDFGERAAMFSAATSALADAKSVRALA